MSAIMNWSRVLVLAALVVLAYPAVAQTSVSYVHTDALGSVVARTDQNRVVIERREYEPFGQQLTPVVADGPGFTGHVQDSATSLTYMQQRYYDSAVGVFLSVDPVAVDTRSGWNNCRYCYAANSPYKFKDPDGRIIETAWDAANVALGVASFSKNLAVGNYIGAAVDAVGVVVDVAATVTPGAPGGAGTLIKMARGADEVVTARAASKVAENGARGRASEARVLEDIGEVKNTEVLSGSDRRTIPDFQNATQVGEIKDTLRVSDSPQLRAQREIAQATGREHVVVTGTNTQVSATVQSQSTVIRRDDLGPGSR